MSITDTPDWMRWADDPDSGAELRAALRTLRRLARARGYYLSGSDMTAAVEFALDEFKHVRTEGAS